MVANSYSNWNVTVALEFIFLSVQVYILIRVGMCTHVCVQVHVCILMWAGLCLRRPEVDIRCSSSLFSTCGLCFTYFFETESYSELEVYLISLGGLFGSEPKAVRSTCLCTPSVLGLQNILLNPSFYVNDGNLT